MAIVFLRILYTFFITDIARWSESARGVFRDDQFSLLLFHNESCYLFAHVCNSNFMTSIEIALDELQRTCDNVLEHTDLFARQCEPSTCLFVRLPECCQPLFELSRTGQNSLVSTLRKCTLGYGETPCSIVNVGRDIRAHWVKKF